MKVGEWARIRNENNIYEFYQIKEGDKIRNFSYVKSKWIENQFAKLIGYFESDFKDNLEDLLKVGDIVHYQYDVLFEKKPRKDIMIIKDKHYLDFWTNGSSEEIKITAIELHENRVKQVIS